jgi:hypothetical protein
MAIPAVQRHAEVTETRRLRCGRAEVTSTSARSSVRACLPVPLASRTYAAWPIFRRRRKEIKPMTSVCWCTAIRNVTAARPLPHDAEVIIQQEANMNLRQQLIAGAGAAALSAFSLSAAAAPMIGVDLKTTAATENSTVDAVTYRRCWSHAGRRHCGYAGRRYRQYGYAPYYDDGYGYGYGPSVGLYFGGGGRGWGGGGHRGHFGGGHRR